MTPIEVMEAVRKRKGITKTEVAKRCGRTIGWYADIAKGRRRVYLDDFIMIAQALKEDVVIFFEPKLSATLNSRLKKNKPNSA